LPAPGGPVIPMIVEWAEGNDSITCLYPSISFSTMEIQRARDLVSPAFRELIISCREAISAEELF
jgi:hypothetical protein